MKNLKKLAPLAIVLLTVACNHTKISDQSETQQAGVMPSDSTLIFERGEKINSPNFTGGTVWLKNLVSADSVNQTAVGSVTFEPEARTRWHSHPAGQIILALDGEGYYQEKGKNKVVVKKGETVKCPENVPHWHGASVNSHFVQVAITGREKGETVWLNEVTDDEYRK